jgi:hypothetical protein
MILRDLVTSETETAKALHILRWEADDKRAYLVRMDAPVFAIRVRREERSQQDARSAQLAGGPACRFAFETWAGPNEKDSCSLRKVQ